MQRTLLLCVGFAPGYELVNEVVTRGSASTQEVRQHTYSNVEVRREGRDLLFNLLYLCANNVGASVYPFLQNIV